MKYMEKPKVHRDNTNKTTEYTITQINSDEEECVPKQKARKYNRKFNKYWIYDKNFKKWLIQSPSGLPFCKCCGIELKASGGRKDLEHHQNSTKHVKNFIDDSQIACENSSINIVDSNFNLEDQIITYEYEENSIQELEVENNQTESCPSSSCCDNENLNEILSPSKCRFCKMCGTQLKNRKHKSEKNENNSNFKTLSYLNSEKDILLNEKRKMQLEMKKIIEQVEVKPNIQLKSSNQAFAAMLVMDIDKLPGKVQRKLKIDIMKLVDEATLQNQD